MSIRVGDVVKMQRGYSAPGIVIEMKNALGSGHAWVYVTVLWSDEGLGLEKSKDLKVISD